ncbi:ATP-dependent helicase [Metamycoplasma alkalescens 14918]|uniref:DNA 3'-5' helicase n=3 Tax=Metamycoplasma alkalescens TaxID=45363 RepID=N9UAX8_9BACT|nr:UvrD-helicase domain-containing protein [Metamycoplasma alkalescens]ENY53821.1 ATP-dependent helicase [Metamycoplasma alkalescens 14918]
MLNLNNLNEQQKAAVKYNDGPLRIIAGAGSGKTRVLTKKISYLIEELDINPSRILALTFSNKAANEMKTRVTTILEDPKRIPTISTFHSICSNILRHDIHLLGYKNDFQIVDELDQKSILKSIYSELGISNNEFSYNSILSFIQNKKNSLFNLLSNEQKEDEEEDLSISNEEKKSNKIKESIYKNYQERLQRAKALDFDDLLVFVYTLFYDPKYEATAKKWSKRYDYLLVDEFQDTSLIQYKILQKLCSTNYLTIVGDPDQTIYSWRNADINIIINFHKDYPDALTIKLEENYRSTKTILRHANQLIDNNKLRLEKKIFTENQEGEEVDFFCGYSEEDEARWIAQSISKLKRNRIQLKNIAVLFRTNSYSRAIEEALIKENSIYKLFGSIKFYQREEIKDALAYLRVIHDGNELMFLRIINKPSRKIGEVTIEKLLNFAKSKNLDLYTAIENNFDAIQGKLGISSLTMQKIADLINAIRWARVALKTNSISSTLKEFMFKIIGYFEIYKNTEEEYESKKENFLSLINAIEQWEINNKFGTIAEYLQEMALITDHDSDDDATNFVSLMTVHNAKGLEFDYVFICGLAEGLFPLRRAIISSPHKDFTFIRYMNTYKENIEALEEERRLMYVAITRAKKKLFLSFAISKSGFSKPSRFLKEMGVKEQHNSINLASDFSIAQENNLNNVDLIIGDYIMHKTYGKGKIIEMVDSIITVKFDFQKIIKQFERSHHSIKKWDENSNE